jgi:carbamate kinase
MRVVVALGGNALLQRGQSPDVATQRANVVTATASIAQLVADGHEVVVTHGNGPQVGLLSVQAPQDPLDVLDAESEGLIGYLLDQELVNQLPGRRVATLLTQVVVDAEDAAWANPTKPIGVAAADGSRRLVPSPAPRRIVEIDTIRLLVDAGVVVVCAGGGGIPVVEDERGRIRGVEAVIDKDRVAALLAVAVDAAALLMLTDVDGVYRGWGTPTARRLGCVAAAELDPAGFASGSMGPKVEAARTFLAAGGGTGRIAGIGALSDAAAILRCEAGTIIY